MAPTDQEAMVRGLQTSPITAPHLRASEQALLAYADVLTLTPQAVTRATSTRSAPRATAIAPFMTRAPSLTTSLL